MPRFPGTRRLLALIVAVMIVTQPGCLALVAGIAGGAAAYVVYVDGELIAVFNSTGDDTWAAVHTALAELRMSVVSEEHQAISSAIETKTSEGYAVHISLRTNLGRTPGGTPQTRVGVRVGTLGDRAASDAIVNQISAHLAPVETAPPAPAVPAPSATPSPPVAVPQPDQPRLVPTPVR